MTDTKHAIIAKDLSIIRGNTRIVDNLSCVIPAGKCTAIIGPNGCGKTTLTRAMAGKMFITSGNITVLGQNVRRTDIRTLRKRIGIVNPTTDGAGVHHAGATVDSDLTAFEATLTGFFATVGLYDFPTDEQKQRALQLLREVGLAQRIDLRFSLLSTGEQRRCLIARALVHQPELLILDEATAGMDVAGREQVLATIESILGQSAPPTVLTITHHVEELSPQTQHVLLMREGKITDAGPPEDVITPESLTRTFGCKVFVRRLHGRYWLEVLPEAWLDMVKHNAQ